MRTSGGFALALLLSTGLFAQNRSGFVNSGNISRTGSSVVFPAGTSAAPGVQRTAGSVLYPGGGGPQIGIPSAINNLNFPNARPVRNHNQGGAIYYPYPVYGGSYVDPSYYAQPQQQAPAQQSPNVTVIYPPQAAPVIINQYGQPVDPQYGAIQYGPVDRPPVMDRQPAPAYQPRPQAQPEPVDTPEAARYLIAFKDHSVYSAVAYWVEGDTLHYFTTGNTHNQISVSLIDRDLTSRLNKESGAEVKLPPVR